MCIQRKKYKNIKKEKYKDLPEPTTKPENDVTKHFCLPCAPTFPLLCRSPKRFT